MLIPQIQIKKKTKKRKIKKTCTHCLNAHIPFEMRMQGFKGVLCSHWKTVVKISHAKICPHFIAVERKKKGIKLNQDPHRP